MAIKSTVFFTVLPKERVANALQRINSSYGVEFKDGAIVCRREYTCKHVITDYAIRERVFAGATMGFVQGIMGSMVTVSNDLNHDSYSEAREHMDRGKADLLNAIDKDHFV